MCIRDRIRDLGAKVAKRFLGPGEAPGTLDAAQAEADKLAELRLESYEAAMAEWDKVAEPFDGDALLFRAADVSAFVGVTIASDLGWRRLVRGKLDIQELPGTHVGILEPPNVVRLSAIMRQALERAEAREAPAAARQHAL